MPVRRDQVNQQCEMLHAEAKEIADYNCGFKVNRILLVDGFTQQAQAKPTAVGCIEVPKNIIPRDLLLPTRSSHDRQHQIAILRSHWTLSKPVIASLNMSSALPPPKPMFI